MAWRMARYVAAVVILGAMFLVPPSIKVEGSSDRFACDSLALGSREPVGLLNPFTDDESELLDQMIIDADHSGTPYETWRAETTAAWDQVYKSCHDARQNRQTLIIFVVALMLGVMFYRRPGLAYES